MKEWRTTYSSAKHSIRMAVSGVARCVGEVDEDDEVLSSSD